MGWGRSQGDRGGLSQGASRDGDKGAAAADLVPASCVLVAGNSRALPPTIWGVAWALLGGSHLGSLGLLPSDGGWGRSHSSSPGLKMSSCSRWFGFSAHTWCLGWVAGAAGWSLSFVLLLLLLPPGLAWLPHTMAIADDMVPGSPPKQKHSGRPGQQLKAS